MIIFKRFLLQTAMFYSFHTWTQPWQMHLVTSINLCFTYDRSKLWQRTDWLEWQTLVQCSAILYAWHMMCMTYVASKSPESILRTCPETCKMPAKLAIWTGAWGSLLPGSHDRTVSTQKTHHTHLCFTSKFYLHIYNMYDLNTEYFAI